MSVSTLYIIILGYGFLESVYERSLLIELNRARLAASRQVPIKVRYRNIVVGEFYADILVDQKIILELKTNTAIAKENEYQLINYLRATDIEVGLLLNFGREPAFKRKVYSNRRKSNIVNH